MSDEAILLLCAAIAAFIIIQGAGGSADPEDQTGSIVDQIPDLTDLSNMVQDQITPPSQDAASANEAAFLAMIRACEGTGGTAEGYRALFGWTPGNGHVFNDFSTHPRQFFAYTDQSGKTIQTSAAGAYQITATTFDKLCAKYGFSDFSPATQDAMALKLIDERGALDDVRAGRVQVAIDKVAKVWASLPGSNVNQPMRSISFAMNAYSQAGGTTA